MPCAHCKHPAIEHSDRNRKIPIGPYDYCAQCNEEGKLYDQFHSYVPEE